MKMHSIYYGLSNDETKKIFARKSNIFRAVVGTVGLICMCLVIYFTYYEKLAEIFLTFAVFLCFHICFKKYNRKLTIELQNILLLDCDPVKLHYQLEQMNYNSKRGRKALNFQFANIGRFAKEYFEEGENALKQVEVKTLSQLPLFKALQGSYALRRNDIEEYFRITDEIFKLPKPTTKREKESYEMICATAQRERLFWEGKYEEALRLWLEEYKGSNDTSLTNVATVKRIADCKWELGEKEKALELYQFVVDNGGTTYLVEQAREKIKSE